MSKRVVAKNAIPLLAREIHEKIKLFGEDISLARLEPFAKIFLQYRAEYEDNSNTFTALPNDTFLASLVLVVLAEEEIPHSQVLLEEMASFVADHSLSDFASFGYRDLPKNERKAIFLKEYLFSEMLEDFDRDLTREMPDYGEEDARQEEVIAPIDLPDDLLDESIPELQQGIIRVPEK